MPPSPPASSATSGALLLCLDVQPIFLKVMPTAEAFLRRCQFAVEAAAGLNIPIAFTEQLPQKLGSTAPELLAKAPKPLRQFGKATFSALADDGIRDALKSMDIEHLLICGLETSVCVYQTAIDAIDAQFQVTLLTDALGARRADDARACLDALARAGVHVLPSETVFYSLLHDAKHPFFRAYTQIVKSYA